MPRPAEQRAVAQVLAELELCSSVRARAYVPLVSGSTPSSSPPGGDTSLVDYWRQRFATARDDELAMLVEQARVELCAIKRRRFPIVPWSDSDDLRERIVSAGEGLPPLDVANALRCTPTMVRRARLTAGRDPERGKRVTLDGFGPDELVAAGLSRRAAAAITGVARSTLAGRLHRAA